MEDQFDSSNSDTKIGTVRTKKHYTWVHYLVFFAIFIIAIPSFFIIFLEVSSRLTLNKLTKKINENVPTDLIKYDLPFSLSNDQLIPMTSEDISAMSGRAPDPNGKQTTKKLAVDIEIDAPRIMFINFNCAMFEPIDNTKYRSLAGNTIFEPQSPSTLEPYDSYYPELRTIRLLAGKNRVTASFPVRYIATNQTLATNFDGYLRGGSMAVICSVTGVGVNDPGGGTEYTTPTQTIRSTTKFGEYVVDQSPGYQKDGKTLFEPRKVIITKEYKLTDFSR